jgi:hypothetical protein
MTEIANGDPSVMDQAQPAAVPPAAPAAQSEDPAALAAKLALVQQDKQKMGESNKKLNEQLKDLQRRLDEMQKQSIRTKTAQLEESGEYQRLYEELKGSYSTLETEHRQLQEQLAAKDREFAQATLRTKALEAINSADVVQPQQMLQLLQSNLREVDGRVVCLNGGVEVNLTDYLANLKSPGSGWEHHFRAGGARGIGSAPANAAGVAPGMTNPFRKESWNLTQQFALRAQNPDLAKALEAEAAKG